MHIVRIIDILAEEIEEGLYPYYDSIAEGLVQLWNSVTNRSSLLFCNILSTFKEMVYYGNPKLILDSIKS